MTFCETGNGILNESTFYVSCWQIWKGMVENMAIEYMCTHCGKKVNRGDKAGRPAPGKCPRKKNGGPHSWVKNRKL